MDLQSRGWKRVGTELSEQTVPASETWRLGWEPFCVELEVWENREIRGRLCAPGLQICGTMVFESLRSIPDAVDFLEKLLDGVLKALPEGPLHEGTEDERRQAH